MIEKLDSDPGSLNEYAAFSGGDPRDPDVFTAFTMALTEHRIALAKELGVSLETLHTFPQPEAESSLPPLTV